jgi:hypothetical protein
LESIVLCRTVFCGHFEAGNGVSFLRIAPRSSGSLVVAGLEGIQPLISYLLAG